MNKLLIKATILKHAQTARRLSMVSVARSVAGCEPTNRVMLQIRSNQTLLQTTSRFFSLNAGKGENEVFISGTQVKDNKLEAEDLQASDEIQETLRVLGYDFDAYDIKGIKQRPESKSGTLMIMFTCDHNKCGTKQARTFSKDSYYKGVVLIRCEGCNNLHLIADNLGWFEKDGVYRGNNVNVETLLKDKGLTVHKYISQEGVEFVE